HVVLATVAEAWPLDEDAPLLTEALAVEGVTAEPAMWDDDGVDWGAFDLVVVRSTWDYARRLDEFRRWIRLVERATALANPGRVIVWNTDKRYLADLAAAGVDVVPTTYLLPGTDAGA